MTVKHYNLARVTTPTTGVGPVTLGPAVLSFLSFDRAGVRDGDTVGYAIDDGDREVGRGEYSAGTLTRRHILRSTNGNLPIDLSGYAQVMVAPTAEDIEGHHLHTVENTSGDAQRWDGLLSILSADESPRRGTTIWFRPGLASVPSGTSLSLNGGDRYPVMFQGDSPVGAGDIASDAWLLLFFDGSQWLIEAGDSRVAATPILTHDVDWYVNGTTGHDTNYDGSAPTVSGSAGPFRTIQRALQETLKYNLMGYTQRVRVADGDYAGPVGLTAFNGVGRIGLIGNPANPGACRINTTEAFSTCFTINGGVYDIDGFQYTAGAQGYDGITISGPANVTVRAVRFGVCGRYHLCVGSESGRMVLYGPVTINAGGNASAHIAAASGNIETAEPRPELHVLGSVSFSNGFVYAGLFGRAVWTMSQYNSNQIIGRAYYIESLGIVSAKGGSIPGTLAGVIQTGGQFIP